MRGLIRRLAVAAAATATFALVVGASGAHAAAILPAGFVDERVTEPVVPTSLAFTPDNRMVVVSQIGIVWVYELGNPVPVRALDITARTCTNTENGMAGVEVDPQFSSNGKIYVYWTRKVAGSCNAGAAQNRLSSFVLGDNNIIAPASEVALIDGIRATGYHNGGDIAFGKDGYLYLTVGDANCAAAGGCSFANDSARQLNVLNGKIIRITRTGGIPADNPYRGTTSVRCNLGPGTPGTACQEVYAVGLRNPFRFAFDPNATGTRFYINDVGAMKWEEINEGKRAGDYGWPVREGPCKGDSYTDCPPPPAGMTDPLLAYRHDSGCRAATGATFVPAAAWPTPYGGSFLWGDFVCGKIFRLAPKAGGGYSQEPFGISMTSIVHMEWGPVLGGGSALYYTSFDPWTSGQIRRIRYVGDVNRPPSAELAVTPRTGRPPLEVRASAAGSIDPDGDPLTYRYDFGDGTPAVESATDSATHTYTANGNYTVTLTVRDPAGAVSDPETAVVSVADQATQLQIVAPSTDYRFKVGDSITLRAIASGKDGQPLPGDAITWTVFLRHNDHYHPYLSPTTGSEAQIVAPAPEDLASTKTSHLEVHAVARDTDGTTTEVVREVHPMLVDLYFLSDPKGVELTANGMRIMTDTSHKSWPGYEILLAAPKSIKNGVYTFRRWSDTITANPRKIVTRAQNDHYKAIYRPVGVP
jgi:glucose/arabinose dehydrogenase/PKD repeat protein